MVEKKGNKIDEFLLLDGGLFSSIIIFNFNEDII